MNTKVIQVYKMIKSSDKVKVVENHLMSTITITGMVTTITSLEYETMIVIVFFESKSSPGHVS